MEKCECYRYYDLGRLFSGILLKGGIHPDLTKENIGIRCGPTVTLDAADVILLELPDGLDSKMVNRLTEALFPPIDDVLQSFDEVSWFRAGVISYGGMLAWAAFNNAANKGLSSKMYVGDSPIGSRYDPSFLYTDADAKAQIAEWIRLVRDDLGVGESGIIEPDKIPAVMEKATGINAYSLENTLMHEAYMASREEDDKMSFWITALHVACSAIKIGRIYTGYGILRKILHMCGKAYVPIVMYHAKIEEMLEDKCLDEEKKKFIEECTKYDFFEFLWIVNDLDALS